MTTASASAEAPVCPGVRVTSAVTASRCQRRALSRCSADEALAVATPRAAEVLRRLGIDPGDGSGCLLANLCGDGVVDGDEECDAGAANSDAQPDACRTTCVEASCGDGVVDTDEDCDDGNAVDGDGCSADCTIEDGVCGNGRRDPDEECDDGNTVDGDGCDGDCTSAAGAFCGDAVVDDGEECDDGVSNSDRRPDACRRSCRSPRCGDGVVDRAHGETCEPPGSLLCSPTCRLRLPLLGDGAMRRREAGVTDPLARCQRAIAAGAGRAFRATLAETLRCETAAQRCLLAETPGCVERASRLCNAIGRSITVRRERLMTDATAHCARDAGAVAIGRLLGAEGLGFEAVAEDCDDEGTGPPDVADLVACVGTRIQCIAEGAAARIVPRAAEALEQLDLEDDDLDCVALDPE